MTQISRPESYGIARAGSGASLIDVLDRVLDKGVVIAGDIAINLLDIELLTIKIRLLIASVDKAKEMGIDWWSHDPQLSSRANAKPAGQNKHGHAPEDENQELRQRVESLESRLSELLEQQAAAPAPPAPRARKQRARQA